MKSGPPADEKHGLSLGTPVQHQPSLGAATLAHYKHVAVQMYTTCGGSNTGAA